MPTRFTDRIFRLLKRRDYEPMKPRQMAQALKVPDDEYDAFKQALGLLMDSGRINITGADMVQLPEMKNRIVGEYQASSKGFGFIRPDPPVLEGDVFVPPGQSMDAVTGDIVAAYVYKRGKRGGKFRCNAKVIEVLERSQVEYVGTLHKRGQQWYVQPDGDDFTDVIAVDDPSAKDARDGDKVIVDIVQYPTQFDFAQGVILERLGKSGLEKTELQSIIRRYQLEEKFSRPALREAKQASRNLDVETLIEQGHREDLRKQTIITIDPVDARDFDDAISLRRLPHGHWLLGVHIADVSQFVTPGSHLDEEAHRRATSVYLPRCVIPMIPEHLSNGICSLQEGQDRLVKSAYIKLDENAGVLETRFANSVIRSAHRLTYEQVDDILAGNHHGHSKPVLSLVQKMEKLARSLQERRRRDGMLELALPKAELVYDEEGRVVDAHPESDTFSHTMIEMFMLEANEAVARLLDSVKVPFLRRVHPEPDSLASGEMGRVINLCGYTVPKSIDREGIQKLLNAVRGKPESFLVNLAVLRSLSKAVYTPAPMGHYALASRHYCHFTSPIRRYPDLSVHRLVQAWIEGRLREESLDDFDDFETLQTLGDHCSERERNAEDAENDLREFKLMQMMEKHIGEEFDGIVTSVMNFGVFIQIDKYLVEGLIPAEDVIHWHQQQGKNKKSKSKKNRRSRKDKGKDKGKQGSFSEESPLKLGKRVRVRLADVKLHARKIDFTPVKILSR